MNTLVKITVCLCFVFVNMMAKAQQVNQVAKQETAKDTLFLINGGIVEAMVTDTSGESIKIIKPKSKKSKEISVDKERIFSIKYPDGKETIFYKQDSTVGNDFTVEQARRFIAGEQDAISSYRPAFATISGFAIGAVSGSVGSLLSFVPPFLYSAAVIIPRARIKKRHVSNLENLRHDTYLFGYEREVKKKRTLHALLGGIVGLAAGFYVNSQFHVIEY